MGPWSQELGVGAAVFAAGGVASAARWAIGRALDDVGASGPWLTLHVVNAVGCLIVGYASASLADGPLRAAVIAGVAGGLTTYSALVLASVEAGTRGQVWWLALGVSLQLALGVGGVVLGQRLGSPTSLASQ